MANPLQGEVELQAGDKSHVLKLGVGALIYLEGEFGKTINRLLKEHFTDEKKLLIGDMRTFLRAALRRSDGSMPEPVEVEQIMDAAGLANCGAAIGSLLRITFPPPKAPENPQ